MRSTLSTDLEVLLMISTGLYSTSLKFFHISQLILLNLMYSSFPGGSEGKASACHAGDLAVETLSWEEPLEKEMATHSGTLAWKIPWTEEPVGYSLW